MDWTHCAKDVIVFVVFFAGGAGAGETSLGVVVVLGGASVDSAS